MTKNYFAVAALCLVVTALSQAYPRAAVKTPPPAKKSEFGFGLGWGAPSGLGVEYSYHPVPSQSLGAGLGISLSGARYALGYRYLLMPASDFSPFAGFAFSGASGFSPLTVNVNSDSAKYKMHSGTTLGPRAGVRMRFDAASFYLNLGYHFVTSGGGAEYLSGSTRPTLRKMANAASLGGLEIGWTLAFPF